MNEPPLKRVELGHDLALEFRDMGNRYFGDYHRVLIEVDALVETTDGVIRLRYQRPLKRMGVGSADAHSEAESLIERFLLTTTPYMRLPGFTQKLLASMKRPGQRLWKRLN